MAIKKRGVQSEIEGQKKLESKVTIVRQEVETDPTYERVEVNKITLDREFIRQAIICHVRTHSDLIVPDDAEIQSASSSYPTLRWEGTKTPITLEQKKAEEDAEREERRKQEELEEDDDDDEEEEDDEY